MSNAFIVVQRSLNTAGSWLPKKSWKSFVNKPTSFIPRDSDSVVQIWDPRVHTVSMFPKSFCRLGRLKKQLSLTGLSHTEPPLSRRQQG